MKIPHIINGNGLCLTVKGRPFVVSNTDDKYETALQLLKDNNLDALISLLDPVVAINNKYNKQGLSINNGVVKYVNKLGQEERLPNALIKSLLAMFEQDEESIKPLILFWEKLKLNPSYRVNNCLFDFIIHNNIVINERGNLIMYKIVKRTNNKNVFLDIYTGRVKNELGVTLEMPRNLVDDNINNQCSFGFHVCSWQYLPHYGSAVNGIDAILLCEVDPQDIVAIPKDYNNSKIRTCKYKPFEEYTYDQGEIDRILYRGNPVGDFDEDYIYDEENDYDDED